MSKDHLAESTKSRIATAQTPSRSKLESALKSVSKWPPKDQEFFISAFTTKKSSNQIAGEMGISVLLFDERRREILRRFMRAENVQTCGG